MEDTYIIDLFWRRDENAIQLVDKKYNSTCYSIAWKILMNREDSEECVNDTDRKSTRLNSSHRT